MVFSRPFGTQLVRIVFTILFQPLLTHHLRHLNKCVLALPMSPSFFGPGRFANLAHPSCSFCTPLV